MIIWGRRGFGRRRGMGGRRRRSYYLLYLLQNRFFTVVMFIKCSLAGNACGVANQCYEDDKE
jgi:Na+/H+ antiporter NhaC